MATDCRNCPLRKIPHFEPFTDAELAFMRRFKTGELSVAARATILLEGAACPQLFTALSGWGLRYKLLPDGERQVINFVMPGDLIGLQGGVLGEMQYSVNAVTDMKLCVFARADLWELFRESPSRAYDITWLAAREEHFLGDMLATVGRRSGLARVAWGLLVLYLRAEARELGRGGRMPMPFRQHDLADAFGLSLVYTNKTLGALRERGLIRLADGALTLLDVPGLRALTDMDTPAERQRPLICRPAAPAERRAGALEPFQAPDVLSRNHREGQPYEQHHIFGRLGRHSHRGPVVRGHRLTGLGAH